MVLRGWGGSVATAAGVAAAVGAAQLGLGYGMDIISWAPDSSGQLSSTAWIASLTWASWIAASSAIAGALVADRLTAPVDRPGPPVGDPGSPAGDRVSGILWRLVLATAAALGACLAVLLVAVPARVAEVAETSAPQAVAAGYAVVGVLVGLAMAVAALTARAVATNLIATAAWLWLLAIVAVVDGVIAGRDWARVPLAFWEFTTTEPAFRNFLLPDVGLALGAALVIGALAALPAARRGDHPIGVVVSGAAGPAVLAAAYLLAQPDLSGADPVDLSRHLATPYLLVAGLVGSLLVSAVRPRSRPDAAVESPAIPPAREPASASEPAEEPVSASR
ncbi:MAG TPA: hypothetical protein VIL37_19240 [Natronosporangium sp.]